MSQLTTPIGSRNVVMDATRFLVLGVLLLPAACGRVAPPVTPPPARNAASVNDLAAQYESQVLAVIAAHPNFSAEAFLDQADDLKGTGAHEAATVNYLAALRLRPSLHMARYQLACNVALDGQRELALKCLRKAADEGFWGYELMKDDDDLESVRDDPAFRAVLAMVKDRYAGEAPKHARDPVVTVPEGEAPPGGWPVLLFLHGYGSGNQDYAWLTQLAAANGFVGLAPSGLVLGPDSYGWPSGGAEPTHQYLRPFLDRQRATKSLDLSRLYLCGFSQGATVAAGLVAAHPQTYAGAIAISPGGTTTTPPQSVNAEGPPRPLFVISGRQESPFVTDRQKQLSGVWQKANWPLRERTHKGGHEFPSGWTDQFPDVCRWLTEPGSR